MQFLGGFYEGKELCSSALSSFLLAGIQMCWVGPEQPSWAIKWKHADWGKAVRQKLPGSLMNTEPQDQLWIASFYMEHV